MQGGLYTIQILCICCICCTCVYVRSIIITFLFKNLLWNAPFTS